MTCGSCQNAQAYQLTYHYSGGEMLSHCEKCGSQASGTPDVYWPGHEYTSPNLCDPKTGEPILLRSKGHKAMVMKTLGVREAGDFIRGARILPKPKSWYEGYKNAKYK